MRTRKFATVSSTGRLKVEAPQGEIMELGSRRTTIWTLLGSFAFFALIALMLGASTARTETNVQVNQSTERALVCTLSSFFSFDRDDLVGDTVRIGGRGLLECRNDEGFSMEEPIVADLVAKVRGELPEGEIALSGNSSAFVIPRDQGQLQDLYRSRDFGWTAKMNDKERKLVFRGVANDLVIELNLTSINSPLVELEVESLRLRYDDTAPDLD